MPKMKSHSGAKKRFKLTATGKVKRYSQNKSHILSKKSTKRKRRQGICVLKEELTPLKSVEK